MRSVVQSVHTTLAAAVAVAGLCATADLSAQEPLPAARDLVARHVAAIGGREAVLAKQSIRTRGTFEMPAIGLKGEFDGAQARSGAMFMTMSIPGLGEMTSGFDGKHAWATNPMTGPRLLDGAELAEIRDDASFLGALREAPAVEEMQTVGTAEVEGDRCYRVKISWASGRRTFDCYSMATGLLIGTESTRQSPTGALDISTMLADYKDFGGVRMATTATQRAAGQEQVLRFTAIEFDSTPTEMFAPPPAIATLIQRQKGTGLSR